jgi:hypothetical protein
MHSFTFHSTKAYAYANSIDRLGDDHIPVLTAPIDILLLVASGETGNVPCDRTNSGLPTGLFRTFSRRKYGVCLAFAA